MRDDASLRSVAAVTVGEEGVPSSGGEPEFSHHGAAVFGGVVQQQSDSCMFEDDSCALQLLPSAHDCRVRISQLPRMLPALITTS
eukprot:SAG31_NODE_1122_length_9795_cov_23.143358_2_plen_85_part_00